MITKNILSPVRHLTNSITKLILEIFIPNRKIRRIIKGEIAQNYLKKYVKQVVRSNKNTNSEMTTIKEYTIWQFWDEGIENAPEIVKRCVESVDKFEPDKKHIVLNKNTIKDYIEVPDKYYKLLKSGKIKMALFSDIIRTLLLDKYGGCWIDTTVLLTDKLPEYITSSDFFVFKNYQRTDLDGLNFASYFIHSKPNNKILKDLLDVIEMYWNNNNFLVNYFLYLHIFTLLTQQDKEDKEIYDKIPFVSFIPVQHFQYEIANTFSQAKWNVIKSATSIHKLSYKSKSLGITNKQNLQNTFYEKLLKGELC